MRQRDESTKGAATFDVDQTPCGRSWPSITPTRLTFRIFSLAQCQPDVL
jgi:hypothetical protein